ncbi:MULTISPECIES: hypothetical protein [Paenibacillus]|uniref:hypothetical protein n=1 Tax=Paenibacillus TaxID=44249 RepID=UPI00048F97B6|nr:MULTISPECIES: hypothetical protein [Paenibacillus]MEC2344738.1 hypothetical protein [Paenibacillus barengoltzii]
MSLKNNEEFLYLIIHQTVIILRILFQRPMFSVPILLRSMVIYLLADFFETQEDKALDKLLKLEAQFNSNKRQIEQWVNSWSFGDFFMGKDCESMDNEKVLKQFGDILVFYWSRRAKKNCFQTEILLLNMVKDLWEI